MYFGPLNTKVILKHLLMETFSRYQCSKFFFKFSEFFNVFEYILTSNWPICLNKHANWRQSNSLHLNILKFSDRPRSSDASDFNKLEKLANIISLALELQSRSENFRIKSYKGFSCLQFECLFRQIGQWELDIYSRTSKNYENWKKNFEHWYLENASMKKFLSVTFVLSGPKYMKKSY